MKSAPFMPRVPHRDAGNLHGQTGRIATTDIRFAAPVGYKVDGV
jgi:hypothetical protein